MAPEIDLISVSSAGEVSNTISAPLSAPVKDAVAATILSLAEIQHAFDSDGSLSTFLSDYLLFLPPRAQGVRAPSTAMLQYMRDLTLQAARAAESLSCSSILAGKGSESDDTGDVALWLGEGDYGPGCERKVLALLELAPWLDEGADVARVSLSSFGSALPSTLSESAPNLHVQNLVDKMKDLSDKYCFRVRSPRTAPLVVFFFLGRFITSSSSEWGGLVGIGTWSDL